MTRSGRPGHRFGVSAAERGTMAKPDRGPLRIGLLLESALTPELWSGVPLGLAQGLQANGAEVVPLITLPDLLERAARRLPMWRARAGLRYAGATHQVRKASQLDAILQIGSSTAVDIELPLVFFLDMTLRQALEVRDAVGVVAPCTGAAELGTSPTTALSAIRSNPDDGGLGRRLRGPRLRGRQQSRARRRRRRDTYGGRLFARLVHASFSIHRARL